MLSSRSSAVRRSILSVIILAILATSLFGAWFSATSSDLSIRQQLQNRATTVAYLLNQSDVAALTGNESDISAPYYLRLKQTLAHLKSLNRDIRSLYVTVSKDDKLYFYVDSEVPDSQYYSPPGEYYPDATPLFKSLFVTGMSAVEGPSKDDYGTWVSGLAPIVDSNTGKLLAVLGIDIDAGEYYQSIIMSASIPLLIGLLVLGTILAYEWLRIRDQKTLQLRSELVSIASHELRTPLTGILWTAENLIPKLEGAPQASAQEIYSHTLSLQAGIEDILQLSRLNSRKGRNLERKEQDFADLIKGICETQRLYAAQRTVRVVMDESWQTPVVIRCDANTIKRALNNILSNAIKYSKPNSQVTIKYTHDARMHRISIQDTGMGIPLAEQTAVITGFYRASNAKASGVEGTGMGLYLTKSVMQQHGGSLQIDSKENVGTTVTLLLPRK